MFKKFTHPLVRTALAVAAVLGLLTLGQVVLAGNVDSVNKYAWSTNAGWVNLQPDNGGVIVHGDHLEGYAWGENVGWIRMGAAHADHADCGAHTYANDGPNTYGVNMDGAGKLSGYAWGANVGWINFDPAFGGVTIDPATGAFSGDAWGENIGWVRFRGAAQNGTDYGVNAEPCTAGITLDKDGVLDLGADGVATAGDLIYYTFAVENTGNVTLDNVTVTDSKLGLNCLIGAMPPDAMDSTTCTGSYALTQADIDAGSVDNEAFVTGQPPTGDPVGGNDSNTEAIPQSPAITLDKDGVLDLGADGVATAGDLINYTFVVENTGNVTLANVTVTDSKLGLSCVIGAMAPDAMDSTTCTGSYALTQADIDAGSVDNEAFVAGAPPTGDPVGESDFNTEVIPDSPSITFVKVVNGDAQPTGWTFDVEGGPQDIAHNGTVTIATGVYTVTETGPAGYALTAAGGACNLVSGRIELTVPNANVTCTITNTQSTATLTVVKRLLPAGDDGRFTMQADGVSGDEGGDGASVSVTVDVGATVAFGEAAGAGTDLANYGAIYACDNGGPSGSGVSGSLTMPDGDVTCTFTNTRGAQTLTVQRAGAGQGAVTSNPTGISCGATCAAAFSKGAVVTLTATPAAGSLFTGWGGDCAGDDPVFAVTMDGARACTATFIPDTIYLPLAFRMLPAHALIDDAWPAIEKRAAVRGETFYTTTISLNTATLPAGGAFYFSGAADQAQPIVVDDLIAVVKDGVDIFTYDFGAAARDLFNVAPAAVEVPRAVAVEMASGGTTLEYRDVYGGYVSAWEVWFIWVP